jgi:hypothetical protein
MQWPLGRLRTLKQCEADLGAVLLFRTYFKRVKVVMLNAVQHLCRFIERIG